MNRTDPTLRSTKSVAIILSIIVVAASLSLASFASYSYTADNIMSSGISVIHANAQVQANDMSNLVSSKIELVAENLEMISDAPAVSSQNVGAAQVFFEQAQSSTTNLTHDYAWINAAGIAVTSANLTNMATIRQGNLTFGQRPYFLGAKSSNELFYSTSLVSTVSHLPTIYIAQPLYVNSVNGTTTKVFSGIVSASISLPSLGKYIESKLSSQSQSSVWFVDPSGVVLYASNQSLIGTNVFGNQFQTLISSSMKTPFDKMLNMSLDGQTGISDFSFNGSIASVAYQPVIVTDPNKSATHEFAVLYILAPYVLAATQSSEIAFLGEVTGITIAGILGASLVASVIVLRWNRGLAERVKEKTAELVSANEKLTSTNTELENQYRMQKDLINIAAHELRTPTQSILANTEIMDEYLLPLELPKATSLSSTSNPNPSLLQSHEANIGGMSELSVSDLRGLVESTHRNAKRLATLTQHILEVAKIDNMGLKLDVTDFDLNSVIKEAIRDVLASFSQDKMGVDLSKVNIKFDPTFETLLVKADRTKVYEVLSNLIRNAIEHSKESVEPIVISLEKSNNQVVVVVKDQGSGIDPDILPRLFGKFVTKMGTGLGLYISKAYAEANGGKIWAANNSGERGATFSFSLPYDSV